MQNREAFIAMRPKINTGRQRNIKRSKSVRTKKTVSNKAFCGWKKLRASMHLITDSELVFLCWIGKYQRFPVWLSGRTLRQLSERLWVRFPGNRCTNKMYNLNAIVSRFG